MFTFLFILIPELSLNFKCLESFLNEFFRVRDNQFLHMSPLILYLYLKPLYSILGGSTTLAEPFIKKPSLVDLRKNPLYK